MPEHHDRIDIQRAAVLESRLDQRRAHTFALAVRGDRHRAEAEDARWVVDRQCDRREYDVPDDAIRIDGHQRQVVRALGAQTLDQLGLGRARESRDVQIEYGAEILRLFCADQLATASNCGMVVAIVVTRSGRMRKITRMSPSRWYG